MASSPSAGQYQAAHRAAVASVRQRVQAFVTAAWGGLSAWRSSDIDRFVERVVPVVLAGQGQAAALTDAYLAAAAAVTLGTPPKLVGVKASEVSGAAVRNGVSPEDVYRRAGATVWTALSNDIALDVAVGMGLRRALVAAATDVQLAVTNTSRLILDADDRVSGYRRVPSGRACDLCQLAAQQKYRTGDLMPIHARCSCSVDPIYGEKPPRVSIPDGLAVHEHGELGPVLAVAGQAFRT